MHEFAMCEDLVRAVLEETNRLDLPVVLKEVRVVLGALRRVTPDSLRFAYEIQTRDTVAAGSSLEVTVLPGIASCSICKRQDEVEETPLLCPSCGSAEIEMIQGWELYIAGLEVE